MWFMIPALFPMHQNIITCCQIVIALGPSKWLQRKLVFCLMLNWRKLPKMKSMRILSVWQKICKLSRIGWRNSHTYKTCEKVSCSSQQTSKKQTKTLASKCILESYYIVVFPECFASQCSLYVTPFFHDLDDRFIQFFLRGCKYSIERTKEKLDCFYSVRSALPEWFDDWDKIDDVLDLIKSG